MCPAFKRVSTVVHAQSSAGCCFLVPSCGTRRAVSCQTPLCVARTCLPRILLSPSPNIPQCPPCISPTRRSYETLRKYAGELQGTFDLLVCDEGHRCDTRSDIGGAHQRHGARHECMLVLLPWRHRWGLRLLGQRGGHAALAQVLLNLPCHLCTFHAYGHCCGAPFPRPTIPLSRPCSGSSP